MHILDICAGHLHRTKTRTETRPIQNRLEWAEAVILVDRGSFVGGWGCHVGGQEKWRILLFNQHSLSLKKALLESLPTNEHTLISRLVSD